MARSVPAVLLVVAALQVGGMLAVIGTVARGAAPPPTSAAGLPPSGATARGDLEASPRRTDLVEIELPGSAVRVPTWVVYPEQAPAPVVIVVHDLYGLSDWVRSITDAYAAEGFIAVAPDLLSGMAPDGRSRLDAIRSWALDLPATNGRVGIVGFSWGGSAGFAYALDQPDLNAVIVFYGAAHGRESDYRRIAAPVLGLYGGELRTAATVYRTTEAMAAAGKPYEVVVYEGATVFLKAQEGLSANRRATEDAWPRSLEFLREYLED